MIPYTINFCDENSNPVAFEALSRSLLVELEPVDAQIEIGDERAVYVGLGRNKIRNWVPHQTRKLKKDKQSWFVKRNVVMIIQWGSEI